MVLSHSPVAMILGTGSAVSGKILTNADLEKMVETTDQWIRERSGIERRHILEKEKSNSDIASEAALIALEEANVKPDELDYIIVGTVTPDSAFPSTACRIQAKIGAENAAAFDISAACSGFLYALTIANEMLQHDQDKKVLIIGSEVLSRITDWEDRATCVLFGDGAGAAVIGKSDSQKGILSTYIKSDGRLGDLLHLPGGGSSHPPSHETIDQKLHYIKMQGREVFKHAVRTMADAAIHGLADSGYGAADIDLLIAHQANIRIIEAIAHRLKLPDEKVFVNIQEYGNTSAASIPIALHQALKEGRLKDGNRVLLVAFGGGFTWGASLIQL
jgi:3-oxoacyl-[acyl-carrier-protein] synthase-3